MTPRVNHLPDIAEEMLLDAGYGQDAELRAALLALGSLADLPAPQPGPELAALLAWPTDQLERRRRIRRQRTTALGLAIIAGMGLGVTGVAASSAGQGNSTGLSVQHLLRDWRPSWSIAPAASASSGKEPPSSAEPATEPAITVPRRGADMGLPGPGDVPEPRNPPGPKKEMPQRNATGGDEHVSPAGNAGRGAIEATPAPPWAVPGSAVKAKPPNCTTPAGANSSGCNDKRGQP